MCTINNIAHAKKNMETYLMNLVYLNYWWNSDRYYNSNGGTESNGNERIMYILQIPILLFLS